MTNPACKTLGDPKNFKRRLKGKSIENWEREAIEGYLMMRSGEDYVNNDRRYEKALDKLSASYREAAKEKACGADLARLCLWMGISIQENVDNDALDGGPGKRNKEAMSLYRRGLKHLGGEDSPKSVEMALYNSLGVACQGGKLPTCRQVTCKKANRFYQKAMDLYCAMSIDLQKPLHKLMKKVEENSQFLACCNCAI